MSSITKTHDIKHTTHSDMYKVPNLFYDESNIFDKQNIFRQLWSENTVLKIDNIR